VLVKLRFVFSDVDVLVEDEVLIGIDLVNVVVIYDLLVISCRDLHIFVFKACFGHHCLIDYVVNCSINWSVLSLVEQRWWGSYWLLFPWVQWRIDVHLSELEWWT